MGGGWNNTGVVAFLYINNCRTFYAAGKTLCVAGLDLIEMARVHPVRVATARRAVS